jgi:hypothetical protein
MKDPTLNVLRDGVEVCAEVIRLRLVARRMALDVSVDDRGNVRTEGAHDSRRSVALPEGWLVGRYTKRATLEDLAVDLHARIKEINAASAAIGGV